MTALVDLSHPHPGVARILLDSPPKNFITGQLMSELEDALTTARDGGDRIVVIGSGIPGSFIAHGEIRRLVDTF